MTASCHLPLCGIEQSRQHHSLLQMNNSSIKRFMTDACWSWEAVAALSLAEQASLAAGTAVAAGVARGVAVQQTAAAAAAAEQPAVLAPALADAPAAVPAVPAGVPGVAPAAAPVPRGPPAAAGAWLARPARASAPTKTAPLAKTSGPTHKIVAAECLKYICMACASSTSLFFLQQSVTHTGRGCRMQNTSQY